MALRLLKQDNAANSYEITQGNLLIVAAVVCLVTDTVAITKYPE